jgi:hypothetical protein
MCDPSSQENQENLTFNVFFVHLYFLAFCKITYFTWVLLLQFSRGCHDRENKTCEYENILKGFLLNPSKNANFVAKTQYKTKMGNKIPAKISDFTVPV